MGQQINVSILHTTRIDSLFSVLKTTREDSNKVKALNSLAWLLKKNNVDTSILLSTQALSISEKQTWEKGLTFSFHQLGWFCYLKGNYPLSL